MSTTAEPVTARDSSAAEQRREQFERTWEDASTFWGRLRTVNNIPIARRYMAGGFFFFLSGGVLALLMRVQLGTPENTFLDAETYNQLFTMHGSTMMFLFVIPFIEALANYMLPLMLGTRDLPFPRLTALSFWTYIFGGLFLYSSFLFGVAPNGGWFAYPPLNLSEFSPGINMDFWDIGLSVAEIAAMGAAAEMIVAVLRMRAPGMSLNRLPIFAWSMLVTGVMIIFAFTPLIVATLMLELDRKGLTRFFDANFGGEPLLWQHLFWVFGHPEVYIMFIPAVGLVSHVVQVFARRPLVSYPLVVLAIVATGFISFGLWVHHMFATGLSPASMGFFAAASMVIAIPNGIQFFSWIATLWTGRPVWRTPLLFIMGFLVTFLIGGLTGVMVGVVPLDLQVHDSYFVVAHFHYVLIGGVVFPLFAALYYWLPKVTGRLLDERLGRWSFWMMFVFFQVAFFPMHLSGLWGMPRRVYTYPAELGWEITNLISTVGAFGFALGILASLVNFVLSVRSGAVAGDDPWRGDSLEWSVSSPPPAAQFGMIPVVHGRHPLWGTPELRTQSLPLEHRFEQMDYFPTRWRGAPVVSVLDGKPLAVVHLPTSTIAPLVVAVGFTTLFLGLLVEGVPFLAAGVLVTLVGMGLWLRPQPTEEIALDEFRGGKDPVGGLPLAVSGPMSNGYWGTGVLVAVLATALVSFVASYFYLGDGSSSSLPAAPPRGLLLPAIGAGLAAAMAVSTWWCVRGTKRDDVSVRRTGLIIGFILAASSFVVIAAALRAQGLSPSSSAYASIFTGLIGFQLGVLLLLLVMLGGGIVWSIVRPSDPRGDGWAWNSSLVSWFASVSWTVVFVVLWLTPRMW